MNQSEKIHRIRRLVGNLAGTAALESAKSLGAAMPQLERAAAETGDPVATRAVGKLLENRTDFDRSETFTLEAVVLPKLRPVVFVRAKSGAAAGAQTYDALPALWENINADPARGVIEPRLPSIGRIEVPSLPQYPFGGTGFLVGPGLLMTNRHVAELFTEGLGQHQLRYNAGDSAVDFKRFLDSPSGDRAAYFQVEQVLLVHPYWDMALLRVAGLEHLTPLRLSPRAPEEMRGNDVVVVGYPAMDNHTALDVQLEVFGGIFDVKRLQPGKLGGRESVESYKRMVNAVTHDSSTLGGNSGSAVLDVATGDVVALHFAGAYLKANYGVPAVELARDARVVDAGVAFTGRVAPTNEWEDAWRATATEAAGSASGGNGTNRAADPAGSVTAAAGHVARVSAGQGSVRFSVPLEITVSLGGANAVTAGADALIATEAPSSQIPKIYAGLENRSGYDPRFLNLPGTNVVPLPEVTTKGRAVVAKLEDGTHVLHYHKFSVAMHKGRRLALFTAANVDWRNDRRRIDGRKPSRRDLTGIPDGVHEQWVTDWRISEQHQLPDMFFTKDKGAFDKGHLVRRDDVCWGRDFRDMQMANGDTYHTTNCSPQVKAFNQAQEGKDNWGDLENLVQSETKAETCSIFSGPVLADDDAPFAGVGPNGPLVIPIPRRYWKIIVVLQPTGPRCYGFVLEQDLRDVPVAREFVVPPAWKRHVRSVAAIESLLNGLVTFPWLRQHDASESVESAPLRARVEAPVSG